MKRKTELMKAAMISCFLALIAFSPQFAFAKEITLDDAITIALENNRSLKLAKMDVDKAQAAVDEAFGYALPTVGVSGNFMHYIEKPVFFFPDFGSLLGNATYDILFKEKLLQEDKSKFKDVGLVKQSFVLSNSYEAKAEVTQILFNSAVLQGIGASRIYLDLSKSHLKGEVANTVLRVKKAFYNSLLVKELLDIVEKSLKNAQDNLSNVRALNKQGLVSDFDLYTAEVKVENINPEVVNLRMSLNTTLEVLKLEMGLPITEVISLKGEMTYDKEPIPDMNKSMSDAIDNNLDLKTLDYKVKVDKAFIELDRSEYWPTLVAFGNYSYAGQSDDFSFQNYSSAMVGLTFSMNLFQGGRTHNKVQQSTITSLQTEEQKKQMQDNLNLLVGIQVSELNKVKATLEAQERNVKLAEKTYELAVTRYKEGTGTQLEIQNSDIAWQQAKTNRLKSLTDYIIAKANLENLLGQVEPKYLRPFMDSVIE